METESKTRSIVKQTVDRLLDVGGVPMSLYDYKYSAKLLASGFTAAQLRALGFTAAELRALRFTAAKLWALRFTAAELAEWDAIPVLNKPYSTLLADIEAGRRIHNQNNWGPDYDPARNLCKTEMCTAGHLVNMAGEVGYNLQKKYGWKIAATLIHRKSRPDVPPQKFGFIPQKLAIAYIRERAAEEEKA